MSSASYIKVELQVSPLTLSAKDIHDGLRRLEGLKRLLEKDLADRKLGDTDERYGYQRKNLEWVYFETLDEAVKDIVEHYQDFDARHKVTRVYP